ncbi:galactose mutarotase [Flavobacterium sp. ANB]|uniref:aldose epimerase family protein n=1 Tax=unclassified Flavobacterium TaxID=196869 RepID=UPI0012B889EB|nr:MULTISPECIES: aldose epimerase family protein [unclassified Flavobacterium]MBF4515223.1 galactose mutarotase [Flavobacterium sp. ANB]MTD70135.1 galactose-1-epimerase [Flavobacterium sp. LC2016-13]
MELKHISHLIDISEAKLFGLMPDGEKVYSFELSNKNGMKAQIINYGATVTSLQVPLENGKVADVVLGFDTLDSYLQSYNLPSAPYFGTTIGRYAGRINKGTFTLNDKTFQLVGNNNGNTLHGGNVGFGKKVWSVTDITNGENPSITFRLISDNLDENFPGELCVDLTYTLTEENELQLEYKATTTEDTVLNLTHHSYFNLNGHDSTVLDQEMLVNSDQILETNSDNIPTGNFTNLSNHAFDFRTQKNCPSTIDNSFVIEAKNEIAAQLFSKKNNLKMNVYTDQPSVHVYVGGNCFDVLKGKEASNYHPSSGICFETQNFPDAPNHSHFPNSVLKKGDEYQQKTVYQFQKIS